MSISRAVIVGAGGAIGGALYRELSTKASVIGISSGASQDFHTDYSESSLAAIADAIEPGIDLLVVCNGLLHDETVRPEKRLADVTGPSLESYFRQNVIVPTLALKVFSRLLRRKDRAIVTVLTARVGSISENRLGGWYGYRSTKAAMNQIVKTASIELGRLNRGVIVTALHPGTTISPLSEPFLPDSEQRGTGKLPWMKPEESASHLIKVIESLTPDHNGSFLDWKGEVLEW